MGRSALHLYRLTLFAACVAIIAAAGCGGDDVVTSRPCRGSVVADGKTLNENSDSTTSGDCLVTVYAESIGTDTTSARPLYHLDSIGTDTTPSTSADAVRLYSCLGRIVVNGSVVTESSAANTSGACNVRLYVDSIGTDTTAGTARLRFAMDSIGTDTTANQF